MKKLKWIAFLFVIITGCAHSDADKGVDFTTTTVEGSDLLIDSESYAEIALPAFIRTASDYFLVYEGQLQKIFKFNYEGEMIDSFGRKGKGPGEFLSLTNYWIRNDHYLLYDFNGAKMVRYNFEGSFMDEYSVNIGELTKTVEVLSSGKFVHSASNTGSSLLQISDLKHDEEVSIGEAVAGKNESSHEVMRDIIRKGKVPNFMQNRVSLGANESGIFSFQNARALLQKFNEKGKLLWERNLKIPLVDGVFENFLKENQKQKYMVELTYIYGMHVTEHGAAILLNTTGDKPIMVAWVPNDGNNIQIVKFPDIERPSKLPLRFRIASEQSMIFFVNSLEGTVVRADWPI